MCQQDVGRMISPMIVVRPPNRFLKKRANCKSATKRLEQTEPTIAREPFVFERKLEFSGSSGHRPQTYFLSRFVESTEFSSLVHKPSAFGLRKCATLPVIQEMTIDRGQMINSFVAKCCARPSEMPEFHRRLSLTSDFTLPKPNPQS